MVSKEYAAKIQVGMLRDSLGSLYHFSRQLDEERKEHVDALLNTAIHALGQIHEYLNEIDKGLPLTPAVIWVDPSKMQTKLIVSELYKFGVIMDKNETGLYQIGFDKDVKLLEYSDIQKDKQVEAIML